MTFGSATQYCAEIENGRNKIKADAVWCWFARTRLNENGALIDQ